MEQPEFRAYDTFNGVFYTSEAEGMAKFHERIAAANEGGNKVKPEEQFSGLLDARGDKMFVNDIVENSAAKWLVVFKEGCFCGQSLKKINGSTNIILLRAINEKKIIGNVHQTPEHLEEDKPKIEDAKVEENGEN